MISDSLFTINGYGMLDAGYSILETLRSDSVNQKPCHAVQCHPELVSGTLLLRHLIIDETIVLIDPEINSTD